MIKIVEIVGGYLSDRPWKKGSEKEERVIKKDANMLKRMSDRQDSSKK
jgi:hypothetical protein